MSRSICMVTPTRGDEDARMDAPMPVQVDARWLASYGALQPPPMVGELTRLVRRGRGVAQQYNRLVAAAMETGASYLFTLEDDILAPPNTMARLQARLLEHKHLAAVSALYWFKGEGTFPFILGDPKLGLDDLEPENVPAEHEEQLVEVNAIPMGAALWRMDLFRSMPGPWFNDTTTTQDIHFCRNARAAGHHFAVDCTLRAGHLDSSTGKVY